MLGIGCPTDQASKMRIMLVWLALLLHIQDFPRLKSWPIGELA